MRAFMSVPCPFINIIVFDIYPNIGASEAPAVNRVKVLPTRCAGNDRPAYQPAALLKSIAPAILIHSSRAGVSSIV